MLIARVNFACLLAFSAMLLCGCASTPLSHGQLPEVVARDAADYNESLVRANNAQILLNILRSRDRLPTQYVSIDGVSDSRTVSSTGQASFTLPWEGLWKKASSGAVLTQKTDANPSLSIKSRSSEKFTNALLSPITAKTFFNYWGQSSLKDILLFLFVNKITIDPRIAEKTNPLLDSLRAYLPISADGKKTYAIRNNAEALIANCFDEEGNPTFPVHAKGKVWEAAELGAIPEDCKFANLANRARNDPLFLKEIAEVKAPSECHALATDLETASTEKLTALNQLAELLTKSGKSFVIEPRGSKAGAPGGPGQPNDSSAQHLTFCVQTSKLAIQEGVQIELRSLEEVIYYLGELLRNGDASPKMVNGSDTTELDYLFRVTRRNPCSDYNAATVKYLGETYFAGPPVNSYDNMKLDRNPDGTMKGRSPSASKWRQENAYLDSLNTCQPGQGGRERSAQVLTILSQVLAQHQEEEEFVGPQAVRIVGGG